MAGKTLGPRTLGALSDVIKRDRNRPKNGGVEGGYGPTVAPWPFLCRITSALAARTSNTPGSADADMYLINDGELEQNAAEMTKTVYNLSQSTIEATASNPTYGLGVQVRGGAYVFVPLLGLCESFKYLAGYSTGETQYLRHVDDACATWISPSTCT